jgi:hypothetical protein
MKHINLSRPLKNGLAKHMITQESNNYGDQILSFKSFYKDGVISGYKIVSITSRSEGEWMDFKQMKAYYNELKKRGVLS